MSRARDVHRAIAEAEQILPGRAVKSGVDPRWQAIIAVGEFIESDPVSVCDFALKWARRRGRDLQAAIHCCLIEHLLEDHFDLVMPRMRDAALKNARVAEQFIGVWKSPFVLGQAKRPACVRRLEQLDLELRQAHATLVCAT